MYISLGVSGHAKFIRIMQTHPQKPHNPQREYDDVTLQKKYYKKKIINIFRWI